jgi:stage V sporulation protein D (sporulation-specific penicillin-binding protein)
VTNKTLQEAQNALKGAGFTWKVVGTGATVTGQTPKGGVAIPNGSAVVLYTDEEKSSNKVTVPDVLGKSYSAAKKQLEERGLYMKAVNPEDSSMQSFSQSIQAGTEVEPGTVVEVRFMDKTMKD